MSAINKKELPGYIRARLVDKWGQEAVNEISSEVFDLFYCDYDDCENIPSSCHIHQKVQECDECYEEAKYCESHRGKCRECDRKSTICDYHHECSDCSEPAELCQSHAASEECGEGGYSCTSGVEYRFCDNCMNDHNNKIYENAIEEGQEVGAQNLLERQKEEQEAKRITVEKRVVSVDGIRFQF